MLRFLDVETNPGDRRPVPSVCTLHSSRVLGLAGNLSDQTVALSQYDMLLYSETTAPVSQLLVLGFCHIVFLCRRRMPRTRGTAAYV